MSDVGNERRWSRWRQAAGGFYQFLDRPIYGWSRIVLALLVIPLALSFTEPLWEIRLEAAQYPDGLELDIYSYKLEGGGKNGHHIQEINTLNHYIGMAPIDRASLNDLDWIPLALGALMILALRVAAIGNIRSLVDLAVITGYLSLFSLGRFAYKLYTFGHNLSPEAPVDVEPFMPPLLGSKQIANFTSHSSPQLGTVYVGMFATGVIALLGWHLFKGWRDDRRARQAGQAASAANAT